MLAQDVGWGVLDIAFSPNGERFAYSSWADCCKWYCDYTESCILTFFKNQLLHFQDISPFIKMEHFIYYVCSGTIANLQYVFSL